MEAYNNEQWNMIGIRAQAEIHTSSNGKDWLINRVSSDPKPAPAFEKANHWLTNLY
jgi:hypothetical protein